MDSPTTPLPTVTLGELFFGFMRVGLSGFGGALPWARRYLVEQRRWITEQEFNEMFGFCQLLPGANVVNLSVCLGARLRGGAGALAALAGLILAPLSVLLALAEGYSRISEMAVAQGALRGLAAAAVGLMVATGFKMARALQGRPGALGLGVLTFVGVGLLRWPLGWVLLGLAPLGIGGAFWRKGKRGNA